MHGTVTSNWRIYALALALPTMVNALLPPTPTATPPSHGHLIPKSPQPTASFDDNEFHSAVRRQADYGELSTSFGPASLCGWVDGEPGNDVYCYNDEKCVFHAPNTAFGGMGGCCPNNNDGECGFESTCYDSAAVAATPALLSSIDPFAIYCTDSVNAYCITWYYKQLGITDYGCDSESIFATVYTEATVSATATDEDSYVMMVSISYVPDNLLSTYADLTAISTGQEKVTTSWSQTRGAPTPPPEDTTRPTQSAASSSSSTPTGAIVGGVVGAVVGLGAIAGACFMFWLWMKKKRDNGPVEMSAQNNNAPSGYQSVPQNQHIQGWDNSTVSEAGGSEVKYGPAEFYTPIHHPPVEIDSRQTETVAELPAAETKLR